MCLPEPAPVIHRYLLCGELLGALFQRVVHRYETDVGAALDTLPDQGNKNSAEVFLLNEQAAFVMGNDPKNMFAGKYARK